MSRPEEQVNRITPTQAVGLLIDKWGEADFDEEAQEVRPSEASEQTTPEEAAEAEEAAAAEDVDTEAPETDGDDDALHAEGDDPDADESDDDDPDGASEERFENLSELLEAGDVKADDLNVTIRSNGEDLTVNLKEALNGYQREADYTRRRQALDADKTAFEQERTEKLEALTGFAQKLEQAGVVLNEVFEADEKAIHEAYDSVDWKQLRTTDKAEFALKKAEYDQALVNNGKRKEAVQQRIEAALNESREQLAKVRAEEAGVQFQKLLERIPAWSDEKVLKRESAEVTSYLQAEYSATASDLKSMTDHRMLDMARKAMLYDRLDDKAKGLVSELKKGGKKKLRKSPTSQPGGGGGGRGLSRRQSRGARAASERLSKSHKQADAAKVLEERWR